MSRRYVLEITVQTLDAALAAERGGANRIELCEDLSVGGVTPSQHQLRLVRQQVKLPIFSMVRPRSGDFVYSELEFGAMKRDVARAIQARMDGVVLGVLTEDGKVDVARTKELVEFARPLPVTFHRAFDAVPDLNAALEDVILTGARRILTSGGAASAETGVGALAELVRRAEGRIEILPGGGLHMGNLAAVVRASGAREFHSGLSSSMPYEQQGSAAFEAGVREMAQSLRQLDGEAGS